MRDSFRGYDAWKLASPDDEREANERRYRREEGRDIDAENELAKERRELAKEAEQAMEAAEWDALGATDLITEEDMGRCPTCKAEKYLRCYCINPECTDNILKGAK